jgi:enamine deaminase RidA (YjgF/YER057c/UK114 family)
MKQITTFLMLLMGLTLTAFGQGRIPRDARAEAEIIRLEKAGWEAWKNKNAAWYVGNTIDEMIGINSGGISNKAQIIRDLGSCEVKSYAIDNFKFVMLTRDAITMTYTATQDAVCGGQKIPPRVRSTVNYVRRGGRWLEAMYMETPMSGETTSVQKEKVERFSLRPAVEKEYGYLHAMRIGDDLKISGAVSMDDKGALVAPGNLEQQMKNCYADLEKILRHFGYTFDDVTVENVFTTDMAGFIKVSGYRNSIYKNGFPTGTWLEVKGLALPGQLIEIDMEAHKARGFSETH